MTDGTRITHFDGPYNFLSNFYRVDIEFEGVVYPSVEHAYQAAKTLDTGERIRIAQLPSPAAAKKAGRKVELRPHWDAMRIDVMHELLRRKFYLGDGLRERLLATGNATLVEGNWWGDNFWGSCPPNGRGANNLGKLLMKVREELK